MADLVAFIATNKLQNYALKLFNTNDTKVFL